jgi:hypothetical protein
MERFDAENYLSVRWYDGLLVRSDHLSHVDARMATLFSEALRVATDQPGLLRIDARSRAASQLIEVRGSQRKGREDKVEADISLLRAFLGAAPDGTLVVGLPNRGGPRGIPVTDIKLVVPTSPGRRSEYLLCAAQDEVEDLNLKKMSSADESIDLAYPGIGIEAVTVKRYKDSLMTDYRGFIPLALVSVEGEEVKPDPAYIPPVARLGLVSFFDTEIVKSLSRLIDILCSTSVGYVAAGGHLLSHEGVGVELRTRFNFYQVLSAFMLSKSGLLMDIEDLSPMTFFCELMYPLSRWFERYYESLKEQKTSLAGLAAAATSIRLLSKTDLHVRTDEFLTWSRDLVFGLNETLKELA